MSNNKPIVVLDTNVFLVSLAPQSPYVIRQDIYFNWLLITADPDDDKFVDISVAVDADYLVSDDKHFNVLKHIDFPKVNLMKAKDFIILCQNLFQV